MYLEDWRQTPYALSVWIHEFGGRVKGQKAGLMQWRQFLGGEVFSNVKKKVVEVMKSWLREEGEEEVREFIEALPYTRTYQLQESPNLQKSRIALAPIASSQALPLTTSYGIQSSRRVRRTSVSFSKKFAV